MYLYMMWIAYIKGIANVKTTPIIRVADFEWIFTLSDWVRLEAIFGDIGDCPLVWIKI